MKAENLYNELLKSDIIGAEAITEFTLLGLTTQVRDSSVIGNLVQDWLSDFMQSRNIIFATPENTQAFPDFYLDPQSQTIDLLEVKCFKKSPNFDIADFAAYCRSIVEHPYRLDAKYLIFEYQHNVDSIRIKNIWLKNVWHIAGGSKRSVVNINWKRQNPYNIRPVTFYSNRAKYQPFHSRKDFVEALDIVLNYVRIDGEWRQDWLKNVNNNYFKITGNLL